MARCVPTQVKNQRFLQLLLTQQLLVTSKGVRWLRIVRPHSSMMIQSGLKIFVCTMSQASFLWVTWPAEGGCTLYVVLITTVWWLKVTLFMTGHCQSHRKTPLSSVHHCHKIYPTVTSPEREGSFQCLDGLCHKIERDSPRSHFPRLTFVGDYCRLTHGMQWLGCHPHQMFFWEVDIIMSLLTFLCDTQVIMCCCIDFINQSLEIICWWMSRGVYVTKSE